MIPGIYNLPTTTLGDTLDSCEFHVKVNGEPLNLENTDINMQVREESKRGPVRLELNLDNGGISFVDATAGKFIRNEVNIDVEKAVRHYYDIQINFDDGLIRTYISGNFDITYSPKSFFHFQDHLRGDTFSGYTFTGLPFNLFDAFSIDFEIRRDGYGGEIVKKLSSTDGNIDIPAPDTIVILPFVVDLLLAGMHYYRLIIKMNDGTRKTYIGGKWNIIDDTTRL